MKSCVVAVCLLVVSVLCVMSSEMEESSNEWEGQMYDWEKDEWVEQIEQDWQDLLDGGMREGRSPDWLPSDWREERAALYDGPREVRYVVDVHVCNSLSGTAIY